MDIVIIANFCDTLDKPSNNRFAYIASMLSDKHDVELVSSKFSHTLKQKRTGECTGFPYRVTLIDEPGYLRNISVERFLSHRVWGKNVAEYIKTRKKPDVVYCAIPSLTAAALVGEYCNTHGIRFVIDIQDLWPEAFQMVFRVPVLSDVAFLPFKRIANKAYEAADEIIAVSDTYVDRAVSVCKHTSTGHAVYLGTDLAAFDSNVKSNLVLRDDDEFWIAYCGSLSDSYDLPCVIDAVKYMNNPKVRLIVMGAGYMQKEFEEYARKTGISARFTGYISYPQMCGLLCACNVTVNPIKGKSAASIINKHADYAACGLPTVNTQDSSEYRKLIEKYTMGINCQNGSYTEVANAFKLLLQDKALRTEMGKNARKCAKQHFDRTQTYSLITKIVEE